LSKTRGYAGLMPDAPESFAAPPDPMPTLWIDVEDLFQYASQYKRPSGIQRVAFEVQRALHIADPGSTRFCRHGSAAQGFGSIPWDVVDQLIERLCRTEPSEPMPTRAVATESALRAWAMRQLYRVPLEPRLVLGRLLGGIRQSAGAAIALPGALWSTASRKLRRRRPEATLAAADVAAFAAQVRPGDVILALGANWNDPHQAERIRAAGQRFGLRYAVVVYDTIPIVRPEWCYRGVVTDFQRWFRETLPLADHICAISHATAADTQRVARTLQVSLRSVPIPIPLGSGFGLPAAQAGPDDLPAPGTYVLFVSTIEARKNHGLLLRVWRHLLEQRAADDVPQLVFAGRVGWMVDDLMQQLANADYFGGKIRVLESLSDGAVATLYRGCRFTLFPSLYEGWGLPVTESLALGKPCIASDRTSVPEAGGGFARYADPENVKAWVNEIGFWLDNPDALADWEARIQREFRPVPWSETARALRQAIGVESAAISDPASAAVPATP